MKHLILLFFFVFGVCSYVSAQSNEYRIMSWNLEWMGDPSKCSCDTSVEGDNVELVLQTEQPDIVALQEVVTIDLLQRIASRTGYSYIVSPYCSLAPDTSNGHYKSGQKLAYLYNPNRCQLIASWGLSSSTYPLLSNTNSPYYFFASGRFPFCAQFVLNGSAQIDTITVMNIHGKSGTTSTDYTRRMRSSSMMKDSLLLYYSNEKVLLLGDFNDHVKGSIINSVSPSPYKDILDIGYKPLFNLDSFPGKQTIIGYPGSIIDNIISSPLAHEQIDASKSEILDNVINYISSYSTSTSDHYPVIISYQANTTTSIYTLEESYYRLFPNPHKSEFTIVSKNPRQTKFQIHTMDGKKIQEGNLQLGKNRIEYEANAGNYILYIEDGDSAVYEILIKL